VVAALGRKKHSLVAVPTVALDQETTKVVASQTRALLCDDDVDDLLRHRHLRDDGLCGVDGDDGRRVLV